MNDQTALPNLQAGSQHDLGDDGDIFQQSGRSAIDYRYIVAAIRSNLLLIAAIILAALAFAVLATLLDTPRYTATSTIQINNMGDRVLGKDDDSTSQSSNMYDTDRFLKTQTDVIQSRGLATRVALKLKLFGNGDFYKAMEANAPEAGTPEVRMRNLTLGLLKSDLKVKLPRDSRIVTLNFESADPETSARVVNAFASEFIQSNLQRKYDSSAYARDFVSGQLADAKARLEASERELNDYARSTGLIKARDASAKQGAALGSGGTVTTASLFQLNEAANEAHTARVTAEGRWRAISSGSLLNAREVLSNAAVINLMNQRASLEAKLQQDLSQHLDDYPSVQQTRAELARTNSELQATAANVRASVRNDYQAALASEQALTAQVNGLKNETLAEQDRGVRYALLEREAETNRTLYDGLLDRFNELNASAGISSSNVSIIDAAEVPQSPTSPNLFRNLLIALVFGFGLAALTIFLKDQLDDAIRVPEDVEHKLHLALLGVVPKASGNDPEAALIDPKSPVSEAYNSLRGALMYSTAGGLPQVMLVTSAQAAEGKTTTSYATALGLARMGRKVILIDADMRRPSVHRRISSNNERGLSTLLTNQELATSVILPTAQPNLSVITSGPVPPSPTELLSSSRMEQLVEELSRDFDIVVIDSPPILGLADAPVLSALADGVIFVVESDRSRRGSLKTALRRLRAMRPVLLGAVLTKFDPTRSGNRYSEYYGYQYYQYESSSDKRAA